MTNKSTPTGSDYQALISSNIEFIEKQCFKVIRISLKNGMFNNPVDIENESLSLFNKVIDVLSGDDYSILRKFEKKAKFTTYLSSIISRQAVDMIRRKKGRSRFKERARKIGPAGEIVLNKLINDGLPVEDVLEEIRQKCDSRYTQKTVLEIKSQILGRGNLAPDFENGVVKKGIRQGDDEIIIPKHNNPENGIIQNSVNEKMQEIIKKIFSRLDGTETMILRMRYPLEDSGKGKSVREIARALRMKEKSVYKKLNRILSKSRDIIQAEGVRLNDLF